MINANQTKFVVGNMEDNAFLGCVPKSGSAYKTDHLDAAVFLRNTERKHRPGLDYLLSEASSLGIREPKIYAVTYQEIPSSQVYNS